VPFLHLDENEPEDEFRPKSLEIRVGTQPLGYRPRCNTEIQLEKMKRDRKNAPNIRTVSWRAPSVDLSQEELDLMFPRKESTQHTMRERAKRYLIVLSNSAKWRWIKKLNAWNPYQRWRINTVDLLIPFSSDQLLFILKLFIYSSHINLS